MKYYCPKCDKMVPSIIKKVKESYNPLDRKQVNIISDVRHCRKCGNQIFDMILDSVSVERAYRKAGVWREVKKRLRSRNSPIEHKKS